MIEGGEEYEYEPQSISIKKIKCMMEDGCWKGSLEEEEVLYNLENNYYTDKKYVKKLKKVLKENKL